MLQAFWLFLPWQLCPTTWTWWRFTDYGAFIASFKAAVGDDTAEFHDYVSQENEVVDQAIRLLAKFTILIKVIWLKIFDCMNNHIKIFSRCIEMCFLPNITLDSSGGIQRTAPKSISVFREFWGEKFFDRVRTEFLLPTCLWCVLKCAQCYCKWSKKPMPGLSVQHPSFLKWIPRVKGKCDSCMHGQ